MSVESDNQTESYSDIYHRKTVANIIIIIVFDYNK